MAELEGEAAQLKTAWDEQRSASRNTASRGAAIVPPPPPAPVPMPPAVHNHWRQEPRGDVNDTPSAPETKQSQEPQNNIAPPP